MKNMLITSILSIQYGEDFFYDSLSTFFVAIVSNYIGLWFVIN